MFLELQASSRPEIFATIAGEVSFCETLLFVFKTTLLFLLPIWNLRSKFGSHQVGRSRICTSLLFAEHSVESNGIKHFSIAAMLFEQRFETVANIMHSRFSRLGTRTFSFEDNLASLTALFFSFRFLICYTVDRSNVHVISRYFKIFTCRRRIKGHQTSI